MPKLHDIIRAAALLIAICALASGCSFKDDLGRRIDAANADFKAGKFDDAMKKYHGAELVSPKSPIVANNKGSVFYKQNDYKRAEENYTKAIDNPKSDDKIRNNSHYNLGNALFRQDRLDEAILEYKKALENDPGDVDAKFNLEFARIKLKEKIEEQKKQQQKQDEKEKHRLPDEEKEKNQQCNNPQQGQGQQQQQQQQQKQAGAGQDEKQKKDEEKEKGAAAGDKKKEDEMDKEEAARILRALDKREKDSEKKPMMPIPAVEYRPGKDW